MYKIPVLVVSCNGGADSIRIPPGKTTDGYVKRLIGPGDSRGPVA
jgi:hypothetical protein